MSASDDLYTTPSTAKDSPYLWAIFGLLIILRRFSTQYTSDFAIAQLWFASAFYVDFNIVKIKGSFRYLPTTI
ncbi:MAG: hypothetical protein RR198_03230 [Oscillospiraceae bacterium]